MAGVALFAVVAAVAVFLLCRRGAARLPSPSRSQSQSPAESESEAEAAIPLDTLPRAPFDVEITPRRLAFGGRQADAGQQVEDLLTIRSNEDVPLTYSFSEIPGDEAYRMALSSARGTVRPRAEVGVALRATLLYNTTASFTLGLALAEKGRAGTAMQVEIPVVLTGKASTRIHIRELKFGRELGTGAYGAVFAGKYLGKDVAIKTLKTRSREVAEEFRREVDVMVQVRGPNVVLFYGAVLDEEHMCHVTELMDLGPLTRVLQSSALPPLMKLKVLRDVAHGMATVHNFGIVHRDLKPDNVLCRSPASLDNPELCKVTDFGTARGVAEQVSLTMTKGQGTPLYMAPEILAGETHYGRSVDVYSFGIVMACVWNDGAQPYAEYGFRSAVELQVAVINGTRPQLGAGCLSEVVSVMQSCWSADAAARPAFEQLAGYFDELQRYCRGLQM